jgi:molybdopterin-guanine dinucleotide biosynthesis protein A
VVKRAASGEIEICILAGGLSTRMGRDKSRVRLGRSTMLGLIRDMAVKTGLKVRILRRDLVPRSGPLGGIYSALQITTADAVLFLACDMPFVRTEMINALIAAAKAHPGRLIFFRPGRKFGFPLLIPRVFVEEIAGQIERRDLAIESLIKRLPTKVVRCRRNWQSCLENINTPKDLEAARKRLRSARL